MDTLFCFRGIRLPITETEYLDLISHRKIVIEKLSIYSDLHPALFPKGWNSSDYGFHQYRVSKKAGLQSLF